MKMEPIEGCETSAVINQTPGNCPKGNLLYSVHGESLKWRIVWTVQQCASDEIIVVFLILLLHGASMKILHPIYCMYSANETATVISSVTPLNWRQKKLERSFIDQHQAGYYFTKTQGTTFNVVDTTFCHKVCLLPTVVMLGSQCDELCGLRQIAVSVAIFDIVLAARICLVITSGSLFYSCIATKILHAFLFSSNCHMPRPSNCAWLVPRNNT